MLKILTADVCSSSSSGGGGRPVKAVSESVTVVVGGRGSTVVHSETGARLYHSVAETDWHLLCSAC